MNQIAYAQACLSKHGIPYKTLTKANAGFINDVYLADDCVVKVFKGERGALERERYIYGTVKPDFAPALLAQGDDYLILRRIKGDSIFHLWPDMTDTQREATVAQVANILNRLSVADVSDCSCIAALFPWRAYIENLIEKRLCAAEACGGVDGRLSERIRAYLAQHAGVLESGTPSLVYADAHFDNFLFEGDTLYLIDYEMLCLAPYDYTLDVFRRMSIHPHIYANEADDPRQRKSDYVHLMDWIRNYAPRMFDVPQLEKRLALYGIAYELGSLREYPNAKLPKERLLMNLEG